MPGFSGGKGPVIDTLGVVGSSFLQGYSRVNQQKSAMELQILHKAGEVRLQYLDRGIGALQEDGSGRLACLIAKELQLEAHSFREETEKPAKFSAEVENILARGFMDMEREWELQKEIDFLDLLCKKQLT